MNSLKSYFSERKWVIIYGIFLAFFTSIPYIIGSINNGNNWIFSGFVIGIDDGNSYIANMLSGTAGNWLFRTPYTAELQPGALIFVPYTLLGKLAIGSDVHTDLLFLYHIFRIFSIFLVCLATYDFISQFIAEKFLRRWGLILCTISGGLGWLIILLGIEQQVANLLFENLSGYTLPLEFYSPEAFGFLALYTIPHVALGRACLLWGLVYYLKIVTAENHKFPWFKGALVGILWLITGIAQPLTMIVFGGVIGIYLLGLIAWQYWNKIRHNTTEWAQIFYIFRVTCWIGLFPLPYIIYNFVVFNLDPVLLGWRQQTNLLSPNPFYFIFAYGILVPFALLGAYKLIRNIPLTGLLPVGWAIAFPFFAYAPFHMQRRLLDGYWVALVVLALASVSSAISVAKVSKPRKLLFVGLSSFGFVAPILLVFGGAKVAADIQQPVYLPRDEVQVFNALANKVEPTDVVLSSYKVGNPLPAWVPARVVVGQGQLSVGLEELLQNVEVFYHPNTSDQIRLMLLDQWNVDYVFWGPDERALGEWDPNQAEYLEKVFTAGEYELFQRK